jgi:probable F420-dependent oxidoreductase
MKFWLAAAAMPVDQLIQYGRDAEVLGYDGMMLPEHVVVKVGERTPHPTGFRLEPDADFPDPLCVFSAMASVTTTLRFLPFVYVVPLRNPFHLAKQVATLAALSNNRFVLGTGVGWLREEFETVGEGWSTRGRRMDDMLDIMRDFWDDGYAEHHGTYYDFPRSGMFPVPSEPVPIWIGGHSAPAASRAARFDGYMPMDGLHDRIRREFAAIDTYRAEHGLDGSYERVVVAPLAPDPGEYRRMEQEDRITGVVVSPSRVWGELEDPHDYAQRRAQAERFAEEIMAKV